MLSRDVLPLIDEAAGARLFGGQGDALGAHSGTAAGKRACFAKLEQLQTTGSFKLRGATNKLMSLNAAAAAAGVITSSTGNHGLGVATAAKRVGNRCRGVLERAGHGRQTREDSRARGASPHRRRGSAGGRGRCTRRRRRIGPHLHFALQRSLRGGGAGHHCGRIACGSCRSGCDFYRHRRRRTH